MNVQEIEFAVQMENGIVTRIGRSAVYQPITGYKGGEPMECRQDVPMDDTQGKNRKGEGADRWNRY